jgi:peptidoglycan/LPS O-acetylase OafA/YrhL
MAPPSHRIAALDGLRAVAVGVVIIGHTLLTAVPNGSSIYNVLLNESMGVTLFFVLSGFLITNILVREREKTGTISRRNFYARRALRILPAYGAFLTVAGLLAVTNAVPASWHGFLGSLTFTKNYWPADASPSLSHTWSLAVEEQFYLIWPLLLLRLGPRTCFRISVGYVAAGPVIRLASYVLLPDLRDQIGFMFHTRADSLLIGCAIALLPRAEPQLFSMITEFVRRWPVEIVALLVFLASNLMTYVIGGPWPTTVGFSIDVLCAAVFLLVATSERQGRLKRALRLRPMVGLGLISYSAYLWQQLFTIGFNKTFTGVWPLSWVCSITAAALSYHLIEQPFLRLKRRYETAEARLDSGVRTVAAAPSLNVRRWRGVRRPG